jgi:hypothetical protein
VRRDGNVNLVVSKYFSLLARVQRTCLVVAVGYAPHALSPVALHRKFGFSPPVGAFFDESNFVPLREALGDEYVHAARSFYGERIEKATFEWVREQRDLSNDEIIASWSDEQTFDDEASSFDARFLVRWACMKAKLRTIRLAMTYTDFDVWMQRVTV